MGNAGHVFKEFALKCIMHIIYKKCSHLKLVQKYISYLNTHSMITIHTAKDKRI
jgi:hypothetical protein